MDKNRKRWGYIFDEKLDMLIPNIPRQKKICKNIFDFIINIFYHCSNAIIFFR